MQPQAIAVNDPNDNLLLRGVTDALMASFDCSLPCNTLKEQHQRIDWQLILSHGDLTACSGTPKVGQADHVMAR